MRLRPPLLCRQNALLIMLLYSSLLQQCSCLADFANLIRVDLAAFCSSSGKLLQLGDCSPHFLRCLSPTSVLLEKCSLFGQVFVNGACVSAISQPVCVNYERAVAIEDVRQAAKRALFCASQPPGVYSASFGGELWPSKTPADCHLAVAILCDDVGGETSVFGCAPGYHFDDASFGCVPQTSMEWIHACAAHPAGEPLLLTHLIGQYCVFHHEPKSSKQNTSSFDLFSDRSSKKKKRDTFSFMKNCWFSYIDCPTLSLVNCNDGNRELCGPTECPPMNLCGNHLWEFTSAGDACSTFGFFCDNLLPMPFVCDDGQVFREGMCHDAPRECRLCKTGERRRRDWHSCGKYEECIGGSWVNRTCPFGFSYVERDRVCSNIETCPIEAICEDGTAVVISCNEYMLCSAGEFIPHLCPDYTRYSQKAGRCVEDYSCAPAMESICIPGDIVQTTNCRTFQRCSDWGSYETAPCRENVTGHFVPECSDCALKQPIPLPESPMQCFKGETKSHETDCQAYYECSTTLKWKLARCSKPDTAYDPVKAKCTSSRLLDPMACAKGGKVAVCREGERALIPLTKCRAVLECVGGRWLELSCGKGCVYDESSGGCKKHGVCEEELSASYARHGHARHHSNNNKHHHGHHHEGDAIEGEEDEEERLPFAEFLPPQMFPPQRPNGFPGPLSPGEQSLENNSPFSVQPRELPNRWPSSGDGLDSPVQRPGAFRQPSFPPAPPPSSHHLPPAFPPAPPPPPQSPSHHQQQQQQQYPQYLCQGDYSQPDSYDDTWYWRCEDDGYLQRTQCPQGTHYDPARKMCSSRYHSTSPGSQPYCQDYATQYLPACGEYRICYKQEWRQGVCPDNQCFVNGRCDERYKCPIQKPGYGGKDYHPPAAPGCFYGAVRPHQQDPLCYDVCDYSGWQKRECAKGSYFDASLSQCVAYSASSKQGYHDSPPAPPPNYHPPSFECYDGQTKTDQYDCTKFKLCVHGRYETRSCDYGAGFRNGYCDPGYRCNAYTEPCQESSGMNGYLRDRSNCSNFYQCASGLWVHMPCSAGTYWNQRLTICDHMANVPECGYNGQPSSYT